MEFQISKKNYDRNFIRILKVASDNSNVKYVTAEKGEVITIKTVNDNKDLFIVELKKLGMHIGGHKQF